MKLFIDRLARAIGDSRAAFYAFYAPSWAKPATLDAWRHELVGGGTTEAGRALRSPTVHWIRLPSRHSNSRLPHAA